MKGGRYPTLDCQEIIYNKTQLSWKFSEKLSLNSEEFIDCFKSIKKNEDIPFVFLDVREHHEHEIFKLPKENKVITLNLKKIEWS